jgi:hypothetical protein
MTQQNEATVRTAYEAYAAGDLPTMLAFIDPELEWTYLDPSLENPEPQICHEGMSSRPHSNGRSSEASAPNSRRSSATATASSWSCEPRASATTVRGRRTIGNTTFSRCPKDGSSRSGHAATGKRR